MGSQRILVTGANGQIGTVLAKALRKRYGDGAVITSDLSVKDGYPYEHELLNATDYYRMRSIVKKYGITQIYHLAAVLSAKGELNPVRTWDTNIKSLLTVLELAKEFGIDKVFFPSSIAVFGPDVRKWGSPQDAPLNPTTIYGMSKLAGEKWCQYFFSKYGLDVRSLRYPGIIGHESLPGGGTTDYAVDIYHKALKGKSFVCYLNQNETLPMIYMDDAVRATIELMEAPKCHISIRTSYNIQATSFTPKEIVESIRKYYPDFKVTYQPDSRQQIAESWPCSLDDRDAREDWSWSPKFTLKDITIDMLTKLSKNHKKISTEQCIA